MASVFSISLLPNGVLREFPHKCRRSRPLPPKSPAHLKDRNRHMGLGFSYAPNSAPFPGKSRWHLSTVSTGIVNFRKSVI